MPVFFAAVTASIGIGMYAVAALLWDRRRQLRLSQPVGSSAGRSGGAAAPGGGPVPASGPVFALVILGCLGLGTALVVGSCMGLFA